MSENSKQAADTDNAAPTAESLDKVRDILFGAQQRDADKRFARLEERLSKDIGDVREETKRRLESLDAFMKKEVQSVLERLKSEANQRNDAIKGINADLKESNKDIDRRLGELEEQSAEAQRSLRQEVLDLSNTMRNELQQSAQSLTGAAERSLSEIRAEKADRAGLAKLFSEMAVRLSSDREDEAE